MCQPDCVEKTCGSDGCEGICGTCPGNSACQDGQCTTPPMPTLADLWAGDAQLVEDALNGPFGGGFAMHFISPRWDGGELRAYYIANYLTDLGWRSATGLATSPDGLAFSDQGIVMDVGGAWQWVYQANGDLAHLIGSPDGDGWVASTAADDAGHLSYGTYTTEIGAGPCTASFVLQVDNNTADDLVVVTLDVFDATAGEVLAQKDVHRSEFGGVFSDEIINLSFVQAAGHQTELRVYWHDVSWVKHKLVAVSQGHDPFFDQRLASFSGVWEADDAWHLVYEGAGFAGQWPGDIGLATSADGLDWIKSAVNPVLVHQDFGWESVNIGTPSLWREGDTWYLFYHGFDGDDVQVGVATGTDLEGMQRHPGNPILPTGPPGAWDSGTVGWRSIIEEDGWYYMIYEGSTDPPFDQAQWSSGLARSPDLLTWTKWAGNPALPITAQGFGYDGPAWVETPDGHIHVYFRKPGNQTHRATLAWTP